MVDIECSADRGKHCMPEAVIEKKLGLLSLLPMAFFWVSGGIYGNEVMLQAAPPFFVLASLVLFPLIYSLPLSLITAELATALPHNGGAAVWAQEAFGKQLGGHVAYWMWVSCIIDSASYPSLAADILGEISELPAFARQLTAVLFAALITIVKLRGMRDTAFMSALFMAAGVLPVILYVLLSWDGLNFTAIASTSGVHNWRLLMSWLAWTFGGFMSVGTIAGQVEQPQHVYPKLIVILIVLVVVQNVVPIALFVSQDPSLSNYKVGHFATLAGYTGGPPLKVAFIFAAWVCQLGMCNGMSILSDCMLAHFIDSRLEAILESTALAKTWVMSVQPETSTRPFYPLLNACFMCTLSRFPLQVLVSCEMLLFTLVSLACFAAFVEMKRSHPQLPRAFVFPGGLLGAMVLVSVPSIVTLLQIALGVLEAMESGEGFAYLLSIFCVLALGFIAELVVNTQRIFCGQHRATA